MIGKLFYKLLSESEIMESSSTGRTYKFHTTLIDDLYDIADEISKDFKDCGIDVYDVKILKRSGEVRFKTKGYSEKQVRKHINLSSLKIYHKWADGEIWWEADYRDFNKKYNDNLTEYSKEIKKLAIFLKDNYQNTSYHHILNRYEDSIKIVLNTIREDKESNSGEITQDILEKSQLIINRLHTAVDDKKSEIEAVESLQDKVTQKSLVGRLDAELEFIEKFIKV